MESTIEPLVLTHLFAAVGAIALGLVAMSRGHRSELLTSIFVAALAVAAWNAAKAVNLVSSAVTLRILVGILSPLPIWAFMVLVLRATLRWSWLRRLAAIGSAICTCGLAGASALELVVSRLEGFVFSSLWNVLLAVVALSHMVLCSALLVRQIWRERGEPRLLALTLLIAGLLGFAGALTEVLPVDRPWHLGSLGLLLAVAVAAIGVTSRQHIGESIALKEILLSLAIVAGIVIVAIMVTEQARGEPAVAAALLAGAGLCAFGSYRLLARRWQHRLEDASRLAALGHATGVLAHEVRNPLTTVKGTLDLLESRLADGQERYLEMARGELDRVLTLVEDCLVYARAPAPSHERFDLLRLIEQTVSAARIRFERVTVVWRSPGDPVEICGDPGQLRRLLENLIVNACQAAPEGDVAVSLGDTSSDRVAVLVRDRGPGVPATVARRIFEPFFTTKTRGGGLGLAIVREIARRHGGDVVLRDGHPGALFEAWWQRHPTWTGEEPSDDTASPSAGPDC